MDAGTWNLQTPGGADAGSVEGGERPRPSRSFATLIANGRWLVGTVISSPDPVLAERVAQAFDFVWIDLEHSALTIRDAQLLAIAAQAGDASALIRVPTFDSGLIGAALDAGADGVVAPKVETPAQAEILATAARYPPRGTRGFAPRRATRGQATAAAVLCSSSSTMCVVQIETRRAVEDVDGIAATDGIDGLIVGTADLSLDLGTPLDMTSPALIAAVEATGEAARRHGKAWGVAIGSIPSWVERLHDAGASMLVFSSDLRIYGEALERHAEAARSVHRRQAT